MPSDDTYRRTIGRLDPEAFEAAFREWVAALVGRPCGEVIALDGKTVRGSCGRDADTIRDQGAPQKPLHLRRNFCVSAWASEQRLVLAQKAVDAKTNEISVLPDLYEVLELEGCLVTIDARAEGHARGMGTQKDIAEQITGRGAPVLGHRRHRMAGPRGPVARTRESCSGGGRAERKPVGRGDRAAHPGYDHAAALYISSLPADAERIAKAVRSHWSIENSVHWVLDVSFREDTSRIRKGHGPENVGLLRRIAMNLVRQDERRGSLRQKRKRAGWDDRYREEIRGI